VNRAVVILLAAALAWSCSKTPTGDAKAAPEAAAAAQALGLAPAPKPEAPKPVPAQLPDVVARVNGEAVTRAEFERAVKTLEGTAGGEVPPDQRDRIYRGVLDQLIGFKLLLQESQTRKVVVPDAEIEARLAEIKKQFPSEDIFVQTLVQRKLTLDQVKSDARRDMTVAKLLESEIGGKAAVTPEQVQDFYAKNPDRFKQGERVRASHILIPYPQGADDAAKAQARAKAEQVLKEVKGGGDFATLAKKYSQDPGSAPNGGDLGFFQQGQMVGPFNEVAFRLTPGTVSDLVETQFGLHIIKVAEKQPARDVPLDEVRPQVEQFLKGQNQQQQTAAFVEALKAKSKIEVLM
jgi:peptidyl-prolyl cis-trans isomerase C